MKLALDTNAYTALQLGNVPNLKELVDRAELIVMPFVVDAELRAGFQKGKRGIDNYNKLKRFQDLDRVLILWPSELTSELYAQVWSELTSKGNPIPTNDVWIAAICLQHQLKLVSVDKHFDSVPLLHTIRF